MNVTVGPLRRSLRYFALLRQFATKPFALGFLLFLVSLLVACASTPDFNLQSVDKTIQPRDVVASPATYQGKQVLWGGVIVHSANAKSGTELKLLAYPLDRNLKPQTGSDSLGRIIVFKEGYLETLDYAPGRLLTVTGTVQGTKKAPVGEAMYTYPVVKSMQIHLWPYQEEAGESRVHFGIGVGVSVH
jgi:outer membrane lipoprotein